MEPSSTTSTVKRLVGRATLLAMAAGFAWLLWHYPLKVLVESVALLWSVPWALGLFPGFWLRRGDHLPAADADLERRRTVWNALSELYLDTELDEHDRERIAAVLVASGYSARQLEEILYRELHPVLHGNLLSVAGEWAGFETKWLQEQILRRAHRRAGFGVIPGKWMVRNEWAAIEAKLRARC
jgi:hypothetical protein